MLACFLPRETTKREDDRPMRYGGFLDVSIYLSTYLLSYLPTYLVIYYRVMHRTVRSVYGGWAMPWHWNAGYKNPFRTVTSNGTTPPSTVKARAQRIARENRGGAVAGGTNEPSYLPSYRPPSPARQRWSVFGQSQPPKATSRVEEGGAASAGRHSVQ